MHLNPLLHAIVDKLPHHSEKDRAELHDSVDLAVEPPPEPDPVKTAAEEKEAELAELRAAVAKLQERERQLAPEETAQEPDKKKAAA